MKKLLLIFSCIALLSCDWAKTVDYIYAVTQNYTNKSGQDIKIYSFNEGVKYSHQLFVDHFITEQYTLEESIKDKHKRMIGFSDSIHVIFNDTKIQKWERSDSSSSRNPLRKENSEHTKVSDLHDVLDFTFTPQDYDDALPCNGNCD